MGKSIQLVVLALCLTGCNKRSREVVQEEYVHQYGVKVAEKDWEERGGFGQVITTQKNGVVVKKTFHAGTLDGPTTYTFPHSDTIEKTEVYQHGKLLREIKHYPTGNPEREILFHGPDSKTVTFWYEEGAPQRIEEYEGDVLVEGKYFTKSNILESKIDQGEGTRINRDLFGQLVSTDVFKDGQLVNRMTYHPNGSPHEIIPYANAKVHGAKKVFLPGGEPISVEHFSNGHLDGLTTFYQNGEKKQEISYSNGKKDGMERRFKHDTIVVEEIYWKEGMRHGPSMTLVNDTKTTEWYFDNRRVPKKEYDRLMKMPVVKS